MGLILKKELPFGNTVEYWKITSINVIFKKKYVEDFSEVNEIEFILSGYITKDLRDKGKEPICHNTFNCSIDILNTNGVDIRDFLYASIKLNPEWYSAEDEN